MYSKILDKIREKVKKEEYILTYHAEEEMDADEFIDVFADFLTLKKK